ncbi:hypothetical protein DL766_008785 [Monosporascus sp. MC13-8B]|uniref:Glucose-methanol-choline oxidoreductase N-terminal domain-containing protein n=1 Tax=Monosporascus cannonballus TaxID=155416 RepID=A0ABY0H3U2_9PEZI|nr:hypothetical protein DL762_005805 [Monosporascus cannonballus]RYO93508.1 hypothetical protein DL763_004351 [Monosporascus cannonballus]RYP17950.1 hypothetical protein DL766_008785 [Monosporascus sp. MC13-8B]
MVGDSYDFVVVGGGTAGLVVASRLSEDPTQRILVLEAGSDHTKDPRVQIPAFYEVLMGSEADWAFRSEPQPNLNGRSISLNQGKALGGSSAINAHVFVPPAKGLIDAWEALGNSGCNWEAFQKYYAKTFTVPSVERGLEKSLGVGEWASGHQSATGPIQVSFSGDSSHPIRKAWAETFKAIGYHMTEDPNINASAGSFSCLASIHPQKKARSYAASAYYGPVKNRENLHVLTKAVVEKVIFEDSVSKKATGVQYRLNNKVKLAVSRKEVIVAAGALQSPKLLELSGIGDATLLRTHGIKIVEDIPAVGENLHDHVVCNICFEAVDNLDTLDDLVRQDPEVLKQAMQEYAASQSGLLTSVGVTTYAYIPIIPEEGQKKVKNLLRDNKPPPDRRQDQAYYEVAEKSLLDPKEPSGAYLTVAGQAILPVDPNSNSPQGPVPGKYITIGAMLSQPLSRGSVHISSANIADSPIINPNYLSNPVDLEVLAHHMLFLETIATSPPLRNLLKHPLNRRDPASHLTDVESAKRYIRTSAISMWHLVGTCAMLPRERGGVVDVTLKVYGVDGLRVVDSSAIPLVSTANLQATVYAFAERAADLIKREYGLK